MKFSSRIVNVAKTSINWFPKHMNSGLKQMQAKLRTVDCVIEIHDARIPFTGRHINFAHQIIGNKPHLLVLNKSDLINSAQRNTIIKSLSLTSSNRILFTSLKSDRNEGVLKLIPTVKKMVEGNVHRSGESGGREYHAMIIGIPNVGKSSLINMLRAKYLKKGRAVQVGPSAGVTKCVHEKVKVSEVPLIYFYDTPGILAPKCADVESGLKLAVCGNLPDHKVGEQVIVEYLLYQLNKNKCYEYVKYLGLQGPTDCITTALSAGAIKNRFVSKLRSTEGGYINKPDLHLTATHFLMEFRKGKLGDILLDEVQELPSDFRSRSDLDSQAHSDAATN